MTTKEVIQKYFADLNERKDWESLIADNMKFSSPSGKTEGKDTYVKATQRLISVVQSVKIKRLIIEGYNASVIANYNLTSSKGLTSVMTVAEIFEVKNNKIQSSAIFFDTTAFREFIAKG